MLLLLTASVIGAQTGVRDRDLVAWVYHEGFHGNWVDESDRSKRTLRAGSGIYSDSRIVRHTPLAKEDGLVLRLRNGERFDQFKCSTPQLCDAPLPLKKVLDKVAPRMIPKWRRLESTLSDARETSPFSPRDTAFSDSLRAADVIGPESKPGEYFFAWCPDYLDRPCPDTPQPIRVAWPEQRANELSVDGVPKGLHRFVRLRQVYGRWLYDAQSVWVLRADGEMAEYVSREIAQIRTDWQRVQDATEVDVRRVIVSFMASRAGAPPPQ